MKPLAIGFFIVISGLIIYIALPKKSNRNMNVKQRILKTAYPLVMKLSKKNHLENKEKIKANEDFFKIDITLNDENNLVFDSFKGKKIMIVNTASDCGFTGQYEQLEQLYQKHKDSMIIIGFPSNEFGNQENGSDSNISSFCKINYGVSFLMAKKGEVLKSNTQQNIYKWLTNKNLNGWNEQAPTWNFCKYIIDENGVLTHFFNSAVDPLGKEIEVALGF